MDVAITGSSGLLGTALKHRLGLAGHRVVPVVRRAPGPDEIGWDIDAGTIDQPAFEGLDAVVHLAGVGVADRRWSESRKQAILESRTKGTALLATALAGCQRPPAVLVSSSAIGYYGDRGDEVLTEESGPGTGFLADLCQRWETAAHPAADAGIRVATIRTGIVLSDEAGALGKTLILFKLGLGGKVGPGTQFLSWITIDDEVGAIMFLLDNDVAGPVNLTAPNPVTNEVYTKAIGTVLGRPTFLSVPALAPKLLLGSEMADRIIFDSARIIPQVLLDAGYQFQHPELEDGLRAVLGRDHETAR